MEYDVVTFGSAVIDVFVNTDTGERRNFISYPAGAKILIKNLKFDVGGGGTNTAVAFSRLGLKTGCISKIGNDENGNKILSLLEKEHVDFLGQQQKNAMTGYSVILDSKENNRTILTYKGVNNNIKFGDINKKLKTKWLYLSSLLGQSFKTQRKLAQILVQKGTKLAFNPSSYIIKKLNLKPILKLCHVLILNKEEAQMLTDKRQDLLIELYKLGPRIIVITDKNKLVNCYDGNKKYFVKPHKTRVVERTGAGDAFASGFTAGLIAGKKIPESLKFGLREAESIIKYFGAKNKLLRMKLK